MFLHYFGDIIPRTHGAIDVGLEMFRVNGAHLTAFQVLLTDWNPFPTIVEILLCNQSHLKFYHLAIINARKSLRCIMAGTGVLTKSLGFSFAVLSENFAPSAIYSYTTAGG